MTTLREAAQQALEAMSSFESATGGLYEGEFEAEIAALRAALAEPENWELRRLSEELERCKQTCAATSEAWREEAALAEPVQEPVAWIHTDPDKRRVKFLEWRENEPGYRGDWIKTPLYAAPPQPEERNFCPRCGKRSSGIHTCTPP